MIPQAIRPPNKGISAERCKAWRAANPEKYKSSISAWYAKNIKKAKDSASTWRKSNPEKRRIQSQNRRARKLQNGGKLSSGLAERLFKLQRGKCPCCKQPLGDDYNLDHIVPLAMGGANEDWNIQLLRKLCNSQKHAKDPIEFMKERGFLL